MEPRGRLSRLKNLLYLGKCQSDNFSAQIASFTLALIQYNILIAEAIFTDGSAVVEENPTYRIRDVNSLEKSN